MKKVITMVLIVFILLSLHTVFALEEKNIMDKNSTSELLGIKEKAGGLIDEYVEKYGSQSYGITAYVLKMISIYSIPICFLGIAVGAIAQYAIGTRRLDMRHKGSRMMLAFITLLVICQVMPLIFAIVVRGWRG